MVVSYAYSPHYKPSFIFAMIIMTGMHPLLEMQPDFISNHILISHSLIFEASIDHDLHLLLKRLW